MIKNVDVVRVWEDGVQVCWQRRDGSTQCAYNLLYETDDGHKTLKRILEEQITVPATASRSEVF